MNKFKNFLRSIYAYIYTAVKQIAKNSYIAIAYKRKTRIPKETPILNCRKEDIEILSSTTFVVFHIKAEGKTLFFKEVKFRTNFRKYIFDCIDTFFYFAGNNNNMKKAKDVIISSLSSKENLKKFKNMGLMTDEESNLSEFLKTKDGTIIGLHYDSNDAELTEQVIHFTKEIAQSYVLMYKYSRKIRALGSYFSSRQMSYKAIANLLGLGSLVPKSEYLRVIIDGKKELFGIATEKANGISVNEIENCVDAATPELVMALEKLNLLDCICLEQDHAKDNMLYIIDEDKHIKSVNVFDNCSFNSFFASANIHFRSFYQSAYYVEDGVINRPHMSKELAERLFEIDYLELKKALSAYLPTINIVFTYLRVVKIKKAINNSAAKINDFMLSDSEWTETVLKEYTESDLCGTYIRAFMYCTC